MNNFIEWESLEFRKSSGKEKIKCPVCSAVKERKGDRSIQVDHKDGFGKCFRCESLTFRESESREVKEKNYKLPVQDWKNYTELSDNMVKYIEDTRKISQSTLKAFNITEEKQYQPAIGKNTNNIVFNYFEKDVLVNKKYRDSKKNFTQSSGTRSIFYNINSVINSDVVWICEGEFDCMALYEVGIKSSISVPNGANDNDDYWKNSEKYLKDVKRFVIAVDNDEKGIALKEKIAQRLGRYRCDFIEFENKDANGDLIKGILSTSVKNVKKFPVSGTFKASDLKDRILNLYRNGLPDTMAPKGYFFEGFKDIFSLMLGQLTVGTGIPSHGKSNFTDWMVLNLINDYDLKASWFSPEHSPMELYHTNLMEKVVGRNFWNHLDNDTRENIRDNTLSNYDRKRLIPRVTEEEINSYVEWADEKVYLTGVDGDTLPTWDWLLEKFKEQMFSFGINIFVIDAFNKVLLPSGNKLEQINIVLTKLTHFAQANNVMIILVAHPVKMSKGEDGLYGVPTLYDVSGSADFRNQTHNGFSIYRTWESLDGNVEEGTDFYNMKTKFNFQGKIGEKIGFNYSTVNGRYYRKGTEEPLFSLIGYDAEKKLDTIPEVEEKPIKYMSPSEAFAPLGEEEKEDEVPF
ncbi:DNA primase/helicase [Cellulophaga phage Nekkels_1]|uniref:DNA primase/helicase n=1 Tax=Cellulophaga phage Nekkels_1 TaxID=2745692 RepID=A0A8E4XV46_9CAUD|nr:DNA primase/helicase [Cellulophaga phage Nekkels_1]QQO97097.1 DNA primase/helicase [Cellulophaga phage Nekkels_1]QQO97191.1 DNA primase/helicase [Cellulophaga phage Nekkels_2]